MPYDPYRVNDIMSQSTGLMLGAGNRDLRSRELAMEESLMPDKLTMMKEQAKSTQIGSMQRVLGLTYQYESRGIPKEVYWPVIQKVVPELQGIDVKDIKSSNTGVNILFEHPETKDQLVMYNDPETGLPKVEKFPGYRASIPELAYRSTGDENNPATIRAKQALSAATKPEGRYDEHGNLIYVNPRSTEAKETGIKKEPKALPEKIQGDLSSTVVSFKAIDKIEQLLPKITNAPIAGYLSKAKAKVGVKDYADFVTEVDNLKLQAQALIKGIPSNFDVQTVINTLPSLHETDATNISRINKTKEILKSLITDTIGYYKGLNYQIPNSVMEGARNYGVNIESIQPWDSTKVDIVTRFKQEESMANYRLGSQTQEGYEVFDENNQLVGHYE